MIADGEWHLYEWNFQDAAQWNNYFGGDGTITEPEVTIDAIRFAGTHDSTIYLDDVSHNPTGSLLPLACDFNQDYRLDSEDLDLWQADFGASTDGVSFLDWQQNLNPAAGAASAATSIPEPASALLATIAALVSMRLWKRV